VGGDQNFKRGFNGDYGIKLTPDKLRTFCEMNWPAFRVGWPLEGSLDKVIVNRVFKVVVGEPETHRWFLMLTLAGCSPQSAHLAKAPPRESK
jgi:hypothetical protein